jgi:hypothetical protein
MWVRVGLQHLHALVSQTARHQHRERRALLRPIDGAALDTALRPLVETIVRVRLVGMAGPRSPFVGQGEYRIVGEGHVAPRVHPQCHLDFLD